MLALAPAAPPDCRELVSPLAAWLAELGFSVAHTLTKQGRALDARWQGPADTFRLLLTASATEARCHLWSNEQGMRFTWMRVHSLDEVQRLLRHYLEFTHPQQLLAQASPCSPCYCPRPHDLTIVKPLGDADGARRNYFIWQDRYGRQHEVILPVKSLF